MDWNEGRIAAALCRQTFNRKCVLLVDRCNWTGYECDVLAVTHDLRIIDVEIKISRADLKADAKKDKWWHQLGWWTHPGPAQLRQWPPKVWKHYYAMPLAIWREGLFDALPSEASGVLLLDERRGGRVQVWCERRATPNKDAMRLSPANVMDVARLANLRMWSAYEQAGKWT